MVECFEANCSRQMGQHKKKIFHQMFLFFVIVLLEYKVEETGQILRGCSRDGIEADSRNFAFNVTC